jgi:hypothetical protein
VAAGLVPLQGLGEGLVALDVAARIGEPTRPPGVQAAVVAAGATTLVDEAAAKVRLRAMGVSVPRGEIAGPDAVAAAAARVGYPVTLKALGLAHKSESGAVRVGLRDEAALLGAQATMPVTPAGYLVEATVADVVAEVLVAVRRDPPVGWLVTLGAGGVFTEVLADTVNLLAPVTADEVVAALRRLRTFPLLDGVRGRPPADLDALAALVVALVDGVVGTKVVEVELNPVLVSARGAVAVDALWIEEEA